MRYSSSKEIQKLVEDIVETYPQLDVIQGGHHICLVHPNGHKKPIPGSPSDFRAIYNCKSQLRRFVSDLTPFAKETRMTAPALTLVQQAVVETVEPASVAPTLSLEDLSEEELEAMLLKKRAAKQAALEAKRAETQAAYDKCLADLADLSKMVDEAMALKTKLEAELNIAPRPAAALVIPQTTIEKSLANPIYKTNGSVNLAAMQRRDGVDYHQLRKACIAAGMRLSRGV